MALRLTMAFSDNPRVEPLKDGTAKPQNIEVGCITLEPGTLFHRNLAYDEFDVAEMSISETLLAFERRDGTRWDMASRRATISGSTGARKRRAERANVKQLMES